jgi:NitT/TauT family transport system substrate-binding protein
MKKYIFVLFLFLLVLSGCNTGLDISKTENDLLPITLKLKWLHQSQFAGNYVAKEKNFYEQAGLDVKLEPFSFEDKTIDAVVNGRAQFGITGADELIVAREKGFGLKAIAVIYKVNPVCAYTLASSGIKKPQDFIGKTVGLEQASDGSDINVGILYKAMMSELGIDRSKINEIVISYDPSELIAGKTDVSTGYIINEPHLAVEQGYDVHTILMADYGADMYADVLFSTDEYIQKNPQIVTNFVGATIDGWLYALENVDEAVDIVLKYAPERTLSHETYMLKSSIPLIHSGKQQLGWMNEENWISLMNILKEQNIIEGNVLLSDVYDNKFVEKKYKK